MSEHERSQEKGESRGPNGETGASPFTRLLPEIVSELRLKAPMSRIYAKHKGRLGISYRQFIRLVREYRDEASDEAGPGSPPRLEAASPSPPPEAGARKPLYIGPPEERTFHFDPMDAYRKKYD